MRRSLSAYERATASVESVDLSSTMISSKFARRELSTLSIAAPMNRSRLNAVISTLTRGEFIPAIPAEAFFLWCGEPDEPGDWESRAGRGDSDRTARLLWVGRISPTVLRR